MTVPFEATAGLAETPHATPMLGVSSAWTPVQRMKAHPSEKRKLQLRSSEQISGNSGTDCRIQPDECEGNQKVKKEKQTSVEAKFFNEKSLESVFDSWQSNLKHLLRDAPSRLTSFSNWASEKLGFSRGGAVTAVKMAPSPAVIKMHLQPVTSNHSSWLTSEGRLKTVTAQ